MAKRKLESDYDDISDISHPSPNAKICGVLSQLSPMKQGGSCDYFDGSLTDGKATIRVYRFDPRIHEKLVKFHENKDSLMISNCVIKPSQRGDQLEVRMTKYTDINKSDRALSVDLEGTTKEKVICLDELKDLPVYQQIQVEAKVLALDDME